MPPHAAAIFAKLGDRVPRFITHNEPWCAAILGYYRGVHAPGRRDLGEALAAAHHLLLSHGLAVEAARALAPQARVGIALSLFPTYPLDAASEEAAKLSDGYTNRWYLDPVFRGSYPADTLDHFRSLGARFEFIREGDLRIISAKTDFLGINYYHRRVIDGSRGGADLGWSVVDRSPGVPTTDLGWEIVPHCLTDLLLRLDRDYGSPTLIITENGAVFDDDMGGQDPRRVAFIRAHLAAAHRAISLGVRLEGYFVWSLMDNFEWAFGYDKRFGVVYVDYPTQRRVPKTSARFLGDVARENGLIPR
jgi:beta-glucosidase